MTNCDKMPELIDRDLTIHELEAFKESCIANLIRMSFEDIIDVVKEIPTIEAKPVRHGRWMKIELTISLQSRWKCSRSKCGIVHAITDYCPYCGAKMDERTYERTYERRCESCIHFVPCQESEEFDFCNIQDSYYEIYKDLPYDKCTGFARKQEKRSDNNANN